MEDGQQLIFCGNKTEPHRHRSPASQTKVHLLADTRLEAQVVTSVASLLVQPHPLQECMPLRKGLPARLTVDVPGVSVENVLDEPTLRPTNTILR